MGVNTGMNQALLGNNPLATIQGVCVCVCVLDRHERQMGLIEKAVETEYNAEVKAEVEVFVFIQFLGKKIILGSQET